MPSFWVHSPHGGERIRVEAGDAEEARTIAYQRWRGMDVAVEHSRIYAVRIEVPIPRK